MSLSDKRCCYVGAPEIFALSHACLIVSEAFGGDICYLVGSATQKRDFRDVDVRLIICDEKWTALFGSQNNGEVVPFWSLVCTSISEYLTNRTGLKIDFQIQSMTQANGPMHGNKARVPLAIYPSGIGPAWKELEWSHHP